jgi:sigma-E factor negative regulatory protein RseC
MKIRTRVKEVHGDWARLVCEQAGQCDLCGNGRGCGLSLMGAWGERYLTVPRRPDRTRTLIAGDPVLVSIADGAIIRAAALIYLLPLTGLLAGAATAQMLGMGDGISFLAALVGALAGVRYGRRAGVRGFRVTPVPREGGNADA